MQNKAKKVFIQNDLYNFFPYIYLVCYILKWQARVVDPINEKIFK